MGTLSTSILIITVLLVLVVIICASVFSAKPIRLKTLYVQKSTCPFDLILYINLDKRADRRKEITDELRTLDWLPYTQRISAVYTPGNGAYGCLQSHIKALQLFLDSPADMKNVLILEDDVQFLHDPTPKLKTFLRRHRKTQWDVLMLASNTMVEKPYDTTATKIVDAQTTAAYAVNRPFAKTLLEFWMSTLPLFENDQITDGRQCDITWKTLQPAANWYCLLPRPAIQRPGFSDIEQEIVDYKV